MSYNYYEEYMREVLGYNGNYNTCNMCNNGINSYIMPNSMQTNTNTNLGSNVPLNEYHINSIIPNIEKMYPEIYKTINPMVCKMCDENTEQITEDLISQMTDKIYNTIISNIEADNIININIETRGEEISDTKEPKRTEDNTSNMQTSKNNTKFNNTMINRNMNNGLKNNIIDEPKKAEESESRSIRPPKANNKLLRDLIKILILNRLVNNNRPPMPPPMPPRPPRPPMPPHHRIEQNFL